LEIQSRERLKIIINSIPYIIYLRDDKSNIIEFNESFKEFFIEEKSENINNSGAIDTSILEDIEGKRLTKRSKKKKNNIDNLSEISVKNFIFNLSHTMIQSFEELSFHDQQIIEQKTSEVRNINMINKNGEERLFQVNKISIQDYDGNYKWVLTIARDITFEKRTEAELLKIQKLDSLGIIAGKIAHDFNNILMGIIGNLSLARASIDKKDELIELLDNAIEVSEHAKKLSNQLLSFSKGGYPIKEFFNPLDVVNSVVDLTLKGTAVSYKINFDKDQIFGIFADKNQFFQVLNNIILNAIQAVSTDGNIEINLEFKDLKYFNNTDIKDNYYLIISICDNGCGIPESIIGKIFDPFFTTKENGSGLGLSSVLTICNNHDGYVFCRNNEKDGATFYILFPATHEKIDLSKRELQQPKSFPGLAIILLD
ncbi:MAG TPA: ATP-binding protein, partial [Exilispira sp.]|nr:ATP-binding protein [Exilispira sp.]